MSNILALDTATDACSVSLKRGDKVVSRYRLLPRQHNHLLFSMLREVLGDESLASAELDLLTYAQGPGSFTGLRIAASAAQGLAYTLSIPVAGISSLACLAQGALRRGVVDDGETVLAMLDARINEIYWGYYRFSDGLATPLGDDRVGAPAELDGSIPDGVDSVVALGSGLALYDALPATLRSSVERCVEDQWPDSIDLLPLADRARTRGELVNAAAVQPVYLRNEIHWKKLSEQ